ncbi:hypothetical protein [Nocardioides cavernaquae]|uniref:Uncharacterized protein n=1 Tax=Nocardioides cavernaquae TaxID=2321396 RepID=A0A3A5HBF9_9ACTN|nr:hypothetical protein [Nocardioides cavernaquae]RJS46755.1 hypothetical protein D4739_11365 [Nocardioides cavernaquae]
MADLRSLRRFHLTLRMLWWGLLVVPLLGGGFVGARLGFPMGVRTATVLFLGGAVVLVLVHVSHLARRPGCPRCLQTIDWLALAREAHNAGMEPEAYVALVRPRGRIDAALSLEPWEATHACTSRLSCHPRAAAGVRAANDARRPISGDL